MDVPHTMLMTASDYARNYANADYGDVIPSIVGLARALGVTRERLAKFKSRARAEGGPELKPEQQALLGIMEGIHDDQHRVLINGGLDGRMNSNIVKLALGKHGYSDKADNTLAGPDGGPVATKWTVEFVEAKSSE